jgi:hypothetical protein
MAFKCTLCDKEFSSKQCLTNHVTKQKCKVYDIACEFCNKTFASMPSMTRHIRTSCKSTIVHVHVHTKNKKIILDDLIKSKEEMEAQFLILKIANEQTNIEICKLRKQNISLKQKMVKLEKKSIKTTNITNKIVNNGIVNNTNIILVGYGQEDMTKIDQKDIIKALHDGFFSSSALTKSVHFNPKYPEYHNVFISNIKDRYAMMYVDGKWKLILKTDLINQLYEDKKAFIEENLEEFVRSLPQSRKRALHKWLEMGDEDQKIKEIKDSIKLLLYNERDIIKNNNEISSRLLSKNSNIAKNKIIN